MADHMFDVIYLTGAPAAGKSTLMMALAARIQPLLTFSYSKELADYINRRDRTSHSQDDMRQQSAGMITKADVDAVDNILVQTVRDRRDSTHVIIDSHPVTKESFGFRVTPFNESQLDAIRPTLILVLYAAPEVLIDRITKQSQGRPTPTTFEASFHNDLQGSVALIYGIHLGLPVYFLDSSKPVPELVEQIVKRLKR